MAYAGGNKRENDQEKEKSNTKQNLSVIDLKKNETQILKAKAELSDLKLAKIKLLICENLATDRKKILKCNEVMENQVTEIQNLKIQNERLKTDFEQHKIEQNKLNDDINSRLKTLFDMLKLKDEKQVDNINQHCVKEVENSNNSFEDDNSNLSRHTSSKRTAKDSQEAVLGDAACNILLLGQTGVGKSTFINAFYNYLTFKSLKEAKANQLKYLIPFQFTIFDSNNQQKDFQMGEDPNEKMDNKGGSSTRSCRAYDFLVQNNKIRLIDTPGFGDPLGTEHDEANIDGIFKFLTQYRQLHAVCILMKPNESRLTPAFALGFKRLLLHLHYSVSKNIVFVFTNTRSTFFQPGDSIQPLKKMLNDIKATPPFSQIPFSATNVFCLDNESFRFLASASKLSSISNDEFQNYAQSWERSANECLRLVPYVLDNLIPHNIKESEVINGVINIVKNLLQIFPDVALNIDNNLRSLKYHNYILDSPNNEMYKLNELKNLELIQKLIVKLTQPRFVCAKADCRKKQGISTNTGFSNVCHDPCLCSEKKLANEKRCIVIISTGICNICLCSQNEHKLVHYDSINTPKKLNWKTFEVHNSGLKYSGLKIKQWIESSIDEYEKEKNTLTEDIAKLSIFVEQNAMVKQTDAFSEYVRELIQQKMTESINAADVNKSKEVVIQGLQVFLKNYESEKCALKNSNQLIVVTEIQRIIATYLK